VPSDVINAYDTEWGAGLLGDKAYCGIFDNSKIKRFVPSFHASVPFSRGAEEMIAWYKANPASQKVDLKFNALCDRINAAQKQSLPA
jgi:hypothetical protein